MIHSTYLKQKLNKLKLKSVVERIAPILSLVVIVSGWYVASRIINVEVILPTPKQTFSDFFKLFALKSFWSALFDTTLRAIIGFTISFILATIFAVISYTLKTVGMIISPIITILRATPTMSIIMLSILWLTSKVGPILIGSLVAFPMLYAGIYGGINSISKDLINMAKVYKVPIFTRVFKMYIPESLPTILSITRGVISLTLKVVISGEVLMQTIGSVGLSLQSCRANLDTASLLAWTIASLLVSFALELVVVLIKKLTVRWEK